MAVEIERKFLVEGDDWRDSVSRSVAMQQAYLGGEGVSVRVRITADDALINIKENRLGYAREEFEYHVPLDDAWRLMALARRGRVEKVRHYVELAGTLWEIDEFQGENDGLVVAEVELDDPRQPFERPVWLGREVTDEERYYNVSLALRPFRAWDRQ